MRTVFFAAVAALVGLQTPAAEAKTLPQIEQYVDEHLPFAEAYAKPRGIPISICLGQAIVESAYGKSPLAAEANNHFGMKRGSTWHSSIVELIDDERDRHGQLVPSKFRKYYSVEDSYVDYCENLARFEVYRSLFSIPKTDYRAWAFGLKRCGYASSKKYSKLLIEVIEKGELYRFDRPRRGELPGTEHEVFRNWRLEKARQTGEKNRPEKAPGSGDPSGLPPSEDLVFCRFLSEERDFD